MPSCTTRTLIKSALALSIAAVSAHTMAGNPHHKIQWQPKKDAYFERVATFPVYHNHTTSYSGNGKITIVKCTTVVNLVFCKKSVCFSKCIFVHPGFGGDAFLCIIRGRIKSI